MENSFVYSKSISFLTGQTRSTRPDLYHKPIPSALSLSLCTTARWALRAVAAHRSASTSLCGRACTSREKSPIPRARALFRPPALIPPPRRTKNLWTGHLGPPHPSLAAGLPFELVARRCHVMAACAAGRCDHQICHATVMPSARRYVPTRAAWATCRLPHLGIVGLPLPLNAKCLKPSTFCQAALCAHQAALPSPQQASIAACPNALPRVCMGWRCPPLRPTPRAATSAQSSTSGKSATLHALHAQLALPLLTTLLAGTPALQCAHMRPPPSLCSRARLRSAAPSAGKRHTDAEPSHPWHREHGYKRATPTSCPHRTPPAIFLK
jgi:hypothetical protein